MQPLNRTHSLLGTLKNIVAVAIPWVGSSSEKQGKRKNAPEEHDPEDNADDRQSKRKRVDSPKAETRKDVRMANGSQPVNRRPQTGYLDPPKETFNKKLSNGVPRRTLGQLRASSAATPDRVTRRGVLRGRTMSPGAVQARTLPDGLVRTQSMDPPQRHVDYDRAPLQPIIRDVSMESVSEERTSPPVKQFRMRISMTPQPSHEGPEGFGPSPVRLHREPSEPPALSTLVRGTAFAQAPSPIRAEPKSEVVEAQTTLGSLAEAQREVRILLRQRQKYLDLCYFHQQHRPLKRSRSSLMLDEEPAAPETADGKLLCSDFCCHRCLIQRPTDLEDVPINIAEKARLSLEAFKTPLLPTRLQGSSSLPVGIACECPNCIGRRRTVGFRREQRVNDRDTLRTSGANDKDGELVAGHGYSESFQAPCWMCLLRDGEVVEHSPCHFIQVHLLCVSLPVTTLGGPTAAACFGDTFGHTTRLSHRITSSSGCAAHGF